MYASYRTMRGPKRRRGSNGNNIPALSDITGTVTDSITGLPVPNATITLVQQSMVTETDEEGTYTFDELYEGSYTVGCFAPGYQVPDPEITSLGNNDSLVIDFSLIPS